MCEVLRNSLRSSKSLFVSTIILFFVSHCWVYAQQFERQTEIDEKKTQTDSSSNRTSSLKSKKTRKKNPTQEKLQEWGFSDAGASLEDEKVADSRKWLWAGLGILSVHPLRVSGSSSGSASFLGRVFEAVHIKADFDLGDTFALIPSVFFTPIGRGFADGGGRTRLFQSSILLQRKWENFKTGVGLGLFMQWIKGSGGTVIIQDGTGSETGYLPSRSVWTSQVPLIFNFAYPIKERFEIFADLILTDSLSVKRAFNIHLGVSYGIF